MSEIPIAVRPAVLWSDQPGICLATVGKSPATLRKWSRLEGLPIYRRGKNPTHGTRRYWLTDEVVAFLKATGKTEGR